MQRELFDTLMAIVDAVPAADGTGPVVTELDIALPLEVRLGSSAGKPVLLAQPPHSRWRAGFLPPVHVSRLRITADQEPAARPTSDDPPPRAGGERA